MSQPTGYRVSIPVFDSARDCMTPEIAARFCAELVRQGVLFDAELVTDTYGTPTMVVEPTGGF